MKHFLHKTEKFFGVYRWHPQIALRYLPVVNEIKRLKVKNPTVLEVGSGSLGIAPYFKKETTGVDLTFSPPFFSLLKRVKATATKLPFFCDSFDFVVMMDMLEHMPKKDREIAILEALRVAKRELIIGVPFGSLAQSHDKKLAWIYKGKFKESLDFFDEHLTYGLPKANEIKNAIRSAGEELNKTFILQTKGNVNLTLRAFFMRGWMTNNIFVDFLFRKIFLLFIPFLRLCNFKPVYRKLFFVELKNND